MNSLKASMSPFTPRNFLESSTLPARLKPKDGIHGRYVALVEQGGWIVGDAIRRGRHKAVGLQDHAVLGRALHVQPDGGRTRAAVECEGQRTLGRILCVNV